MHPGALCQCSACCECTLNLGTGAADKDRTDAIGRVHRSADAAHDPHRDATASPLVGGQQKSSICKDAARAADQGGDGQEILLDPLAGGERPINSPPQLVLVLVRRLNVGLACLMCISLLLGCWVAHLCAGLSSEHGLEGGGCDSRHGEASPVLSRCHAARSRAALVA